ncbi:MAG TPA: hypothetical protein VIH06_00650, partial [Ilumatobacteraceae bacterium]
TRSPLLATGMANGAGASGRATVNSAGTECPGLSCCLVVRDVGAPGRRQIVLAPLGMPEGALESSVRGSTGPGRGALLPFDPVPFDALLEPLPLDLAAPLDFEFPELATPPPPVREPVRLEAWGTPLSTFRSVRTAD